MFLVVYKISFCLFKMFKNLKEPKKSSIIQNIFGHSVIIKLRRRNCKENSIEENFSNRIYI